MVIISGVPIFRIFMVEVNGPFKDFQLFWSKKKKWWDANIENNLQTRVESHLGPD